MEISLKTAHFFVLFLLSSYVWSPAVRFSTGLLGIGLLQ